MKFENILLSVNNETAVLTFNRPQSLNALNKQVIEELDEVIRAIAADPKIRAVVIGSDKHFAAGADIKEMIEMNPEQARGFAFTRTFEKIENLIKPTIAAISGYALGGGLELALVCDIRIASPDAKLGFPEINLGIIPGAGGTQRLPRLIGASRAKELIFQGVIIDSNKALQYGLINEIAENPLEAAMKMAKKLTLKPPLAIKAAKQCIQMTSKVDIRSGIEFEELAWSSLYATKDQKEGMRAFVEKRKPDFIGD
jgi:enoyl-CoA hydratase/carnithine racemase